MDGTALDLQGAVAAALTGLAPLINGRLYQDVPDTPRFPYVTIGQDHEVDDSVEGLTASDVFLDLHVWSRAGGFAEAKRIAAAIRLALHDHELTLDQNRCVLIQHRITRTFIDADGITKHGVVTFRAAVELNPA